MDVDLETISDFITLLVQYGMQVYHLWSGAKCICFMFHCILRL